MTRLALRLTEFSERYVPSAFVIACILTLLTLLLARFGAGVGVVACVGYWGDGLWSLLEFGMQMCLVLVTGSILAESPALERALARASALPRTPRGAVVFTAVASMLLCWVHWGLGIVASAFLARNVARRHPDADYRLLVAVSYFGMGAVWHAGLSGSAPLLVATPKHFLQDKIGLIPLTETTFSPFNLALSGVTLLSLALLAWRLYPSRKEDVYRLDAEARARLEPQPSLREAPAASVWLALLERTRLVNGLLGAFACAWLALDFGSKGPALTLNKLNLIFLAAGLLLHPSPAAFGRAAERAGALTHGIILQFPLYAGIYGIIKGAGLDRLIGDAFVSVASAGTYPAIVYWYSGVLNYFIPSGGAKWAIEAPYILEAARALGVPYPKMVLAYAWGDMVTDLIQPFFCLPLLAVARLDFRDILGYEAVAFAVCSALGTAAFLLF